MRSIITQRAHSAPRRLYSTAPSKQLVGKNVSPIALSVKRERQDITILKPLVRAILDSGKCNTFDVGPHGGCESLVAESLQGVPREDFIFISHGGRIEDSDKRNHHLPGHEESEFNEWNPFHPKRIVSRIQQSLYATGLDHIDSFIVDNLHLPNVRSSQRTEMLQQLFTTLEEQVQKGNIKSYGVTLDPLGPMELKLHDVEKVSHGKGLAVLQHPANLLRLEELARYDEIPKKFGGMLRIATDPLEGVDVRGIHHELRSKYVSRKDCIDQLQKVLNNCIHLEEEYEGANDLNGPKLTQISWGKVIASNADELFNDAGKWKRAYEGHILPSLTDALIKLAPNPKYKKWAQAYREVTTGLFHLVSQVVEYNSHLKSREIDEILQSVRGFGEETQLETKAIALLLSSGMVDCVSCEVQDEALMRQVVAGAEMSGRMRIEDEKVLYERLARFGSDEQ